MNHSCTVWFSKFRVPACREWKSLNGKGRAEREREREREGEERCGSGYRYNIKRLLVPANTSAPLPSRWLCVTFASWTIMEEVLHIMQAACGFSMHNEACRRWTKNKALRMRCHPPILYVNVASSSWRNYATESPRATTPSIDLLR